MLYKCAKDELLDPLYSREEGWRLVVPGNYKAVIKDAHKETSSGHFGREKTYERVAREYYRLGNLLKN